MAVKQNFRAEAKILPLSYLHSGEYIVGNETANSYLKLKDNSELVRVNCIAAVVRREDLGTITILTIDDGSDNVSVRIFDKKKNITDIDDEGSGCQCSATETNPNINTNTFVYFIKALLFFIVIFLIVQIRKKFW